MFSKGRKIHCQYQNQKRQTKMKRDKNQDPTNTGEPKRTKQQVTPWNIE